MKSDASSFDHIYDSMSVKQLKAALSKLKYNKARSDEIVFVSKLIRKRINKRDLSQQSDFKLDSRLGKHF